jgi:RHS repeat-associated protein
MVERVAYDPYGQPTFYDGSWANPSATSAAAVANDVLFTGHRLDTESGLYYTLHRYYHPTLGRWLQRDPEGYVDGMSLYEYCASGVTCFTDPSGLLLREAIAAYDAFREAGQGVGSAIGNTVGAGAISLGAFEYGKKIQKEAINEGKSTKEAAGIANAARHAYWSALLTCAFGEDIAVQITNSHEEGEIGTPDSNVDRFNNRLGRDIGTGGESLADIESKVQDALSKGDLVTDTKDPRANPPPPSEDRLRSLLQRVYGTTIADDIKPPPPPVPQSWNLPLSP